MKNDTLRIYIIITTIILIIFLITIFFYQRRMLASRQHCISNQNLIRIAKLFCVRDMQIPKGEVIPLNSLEEYLPFPLAKFKCRHGGKYIIGVSGEAPQCTYTNNFRVFKFEGFSFTLENKNGHFWPFQ